MTQEPNSGLGLPFLRFLERTQLDTHTHTHIPIMTEKFAVDLGLCCLRGKSIVPFSVTSNRCIPFKSTMDWSTLTFYTCGI